MTEKIIIVDKHDNIIGAKERADIDYSKDIYRVSALWITNSEGKILLVKRALTKKQDPGKWGPAVAGTIEERESYESNIIKEAEEELGLKDIKPTKWFLSSTLGKKYQHFTQWFKLKIDKPLSYFKSSKEEVAEINWFDEEDIYKLSGDEVLDSVKEMINLGERK